jgi:DNA-binding HxlR family transcriptional regulator
METDHVTVDTPDEPDATASTLPACGVARFMTLLEGPWATLIVRELLQGPMRFTELRAVLPGISPHTLTRRLRQFETYGIANRTAYAEIPPRVEYRLTALGEDLRPVLEAMGAWAMSIPEPAEHDGTKWYCNRPAKS